MLEAGLELPRSLLLQRVTDAAPRLVLLEAAAGYGKSWLARKIAANAGDPSVVDALGVDDAIDYHRRLLAALLGPARDVAASWERGALELARDVNAWRRLCVRAWHELPSGGHVIFENVENAIGDQDMLLTLQALFGRPQPHRQVLMCSRKPIPIRFGRFAFPHEVLRLNARELRFSASELSSLFQVEPNSSKLHAIARLTSGWPMAAFLLRRLWQRDREMTFDVMPDEQALFAFLADEVLSLLSPASWQALYLVALLDDATAADIRTISDDTDAGLIERFLAEAPFVDAFGEALRAHPLLRDLIRDRFPEDVRAAGKRAAEVYERNGEPIRAAQIQLALGDSVGAAHVIEKLVGTAWLASPSYELETVLLQIDRSALLASPALWAFAMYGSVCAVVSLSQWLHEGLEVWARHEGSMPPGVAVGVGSNIINAYMNLGMLDQADAWLETIRIRNPESVTVALWSAALRAMRALPVDSTRLEREILTPLDDGYGKAILLYDVVARIHRLRGEREAERAASARAVDMCLNSKSAHGIQLTALDAAFGAWLAGEDALYEEYLRLAEEHVSPRSRERTRIFLECARGFGVRARPGTEKLKTRAYAWLVAAAQARDAERSELLRRAHEAAEASSQPYARILARVARAAAREPKALSALSEAAALAEIVDSPKLREAIANLTSGGDGGMLAPFVTRFRDVAKAGLEVRIITGEIVVSGKTVPVSQRQLELITLLAVRRRRFHRQAIAATLWPDSELETALGTLRTTVSRVRGTTGLGSIISTSAEGYELGADAAVDLIALRHVVGRCEAATSVSHDDRQLLEEALEQLLMRDRSRGARWEWFAPIEHELEALCWRLGGLLARGALAARRWRDALDVGRRLLAYDPLNEMGCEYVVRALLADGDEIAAHREISACEERLQLATRDSEGAAYLRSLLP